MSMKQVARDIRLGVFPKKSEETLREEAESMQITFNGAKLNAEVPYMSYEELASMSGHQQPTITWQVGKIGGTLGPGRSIVFEDGMVIDAVE